jgi:hypothetical protein
MSRRFIHTVLAAALCLGAASPRILQGADLPARKTRTVVLIVSDGLRWQEIFNGAEADLLNDKEGAAGCHRTSCESGIGGLAPPNGARCCSRDAGAFFILYS